MKTIKKKQPMQPLVWDGDSAVIRFQPNDLVRYVLDAGGLDMNQLYALPNIDPADRMQFAQLIGYSVSGYGDLSYASKRSVVKADALGERMIKRRVKKLKRK